MNKLKTTVLEEIKAGKVAMRPRWHFILRTMLWASAALLLFLVMVYFLSFIGFVERRTGLLTISHFGNAGLFEFLWYSPWLLILLVLVFFVSLELLVKHYSFSYRHPLIYSVGGIVIVSLATAGLVLQMPIHETIEHSHLPFLGTLYDRFASHRPAGVYIGTLSSVSLPDHMLYFTPDDGTLFRVHITQHTRMPDLNSLELGEQYMIFGRVSSDTVEAFGVRPLDADLPLRFENHAPTFEWGGPNTL